MTFDPRRNHRDQAFARRMIAEAERRRREAFCDCIASGNTNKPKQHGADPHAKNCAVYTGFEKVADGAAKFLEDDEHGRDDDTFEGGY